MTHTHRSDARNLRQSRTVGAVTSQFTWSSVGGLPLLLDDSVHAYLYGPSSTPIAQIDDSTGAAQYLHADLLGTPRLITNAAGDAVGTVSYDAFGNRATRSGIQSVFGFTGNLVDELTGLLYLRARDYDAATGQFLTVDPAVDRTRQPYAYTGNNPVTRTDPTGLDFMDEALAFGAGALDGLTGGISSAVLSATVPGYDCFIQEHNTAFQVGSVVTQVVVAVVMIVGTAGAGTLLVAGRYLATAGIKASVKVAAAETRRLLVSAGRRLLADVRSIGQRAADDGVSLSLKYKPGWNSAQRAAADTKVGALNDAAGSGGLRVTQVERSGTSAASRYSRAQGEIPSGADIDHTIDLQLGGLDELPNMNPLDLSVNRSLGSQIGWQLRDVEIGTRVNSVRIG